MGKVICFRVCLLPLFRQTVSSTGGGELPKKTVMQASLLRNQTLLPAVLRSCKSASELHQLHAHMLKSGLDAVPFLASNLLAAAAVDSAAYARSIFDDIPAPNLFQYNTVLRAYSLTLRPQLDEPISIFNSLRARGLPLDQFSFITTLKICAHTLALQTGRQIHGTVVRSGFHLFLNLWNTLICFYCSCGRTGDAHHLFDETPTLRDSVSWSALMGGYFQASQPGEVMGLLRGMLLSGFPVNAAAVVTALSTAADCGAAESLHGYCVKAGFFSDLNVATAVVTVYWKFRCIDSARRVFDELSRRDLVLYNCMVDGYARGGLVHESLALLWQMRDQGVKPNSATLVGLLSACAASGALAVGRHVHKYAKEEGLDLDAALGTSLVDMYSKSGCLQEAMDVFNQMQLRDVKAWTAMIMGLGAHGMAEDALQLFHEMEDEGTRPNEVTFLAVLSACNHGGLVDSGREYFERMVRDYQLSPGIEHYGCVIDLLGRAGMLEEAHELIKSLPFEVDAMAWRALLAACRVQGNFKLGEVARNALVALGEEHPSDSIVLRGTYALAGTMTMIDSGIERTKSKKEAGYSSIELAG